MISNAEPKLASPGTGLPAIELFIRRLNFAVNRKYPPTNPAR